ncbi:hypothetical protein AB0B45_47685 [Nonomuraea sp. NPDC049152]|uniref:hypothetical protein n=1 Tax=Nonomuraea sp. NPDC049152 TaxID=3154350 RepID=UPI0033F1387F
MVKAVRRRRSPQEKKRLSYTKDRRNDYGENDKSSRKAIRRNKSAPHRANRRQVSQTLDAITGVVDEGAEESTVRRLESRRPKTWKKWRDATLGAIVTERLQRRARLGIDDQARNAERIQRVRQRLRLPTGSSAS